MVLDLGDLVLELELALLQPGDLQLVARCRQSECIDCGVEIAMFDPENFERLRISSSVTPSISPLFPDSPRVRPVPSWFGAFDAPSTEMERLATSQDRFIWFHDNRRALNPVESTQGWPSIRRTANGYFVCQHAAAQARRSGTPIEEELGAPCLTTQRSRNSRNGSCGSRSSLKTSRVAPPHNGASLWRPFQSHSLG